MVEWRVPAPLEDRGKNSKNCRHPIPRTRQVRRPHWGCGKSIDVDRNMSDFRVRKKRNLFLLNSQCLILLFRMCFVSSPRYSLKCDPKKSLRGTKY